jgi:hypothetical protein
MSKFIIAHNAYIKKLAEPGANLKDAKSVEGEKVL